MPDTSFPHRAARVVARSPRRAASWLVLGCVAVRDRLALRALLRRGAVVERSGADRRRAAGGVSPTVAALHAAVQGADALTRLPTRDDLSRVAVALARLPAPTEIEVCVLCLDLDDFRGVNARFGRAAGDAALWQVGARLRAAARADDIVFRLGGDEFVVIAPCPAGTGDATTVLIATRLLAQMRPPFPGIVAAGLALGGCIGTARWRPGQALLLESVAQAERALLAAKRAGRGQLRHYASRQSRRPRRTEAPAGLP